MIRLPLPMAALYMPRAYRRSALLICVLLLGALAALPGLGPPATEAASGPTLPAYIYVTVSGPVSYDVLRNAAGKETRLARIGMAGVGFGDVTAKLAADGAHVAVRVAGDRTGGSSLRIIDVPTSKAITVTLSHSVGVGIGAFAWSPDSKSLAYTVASPQAAVADQGSGTLWVVGADARGARKVGGVNARLLGWSPDGNGLYYARDDDDSGTTPPDLWTLSLSGQALPVVRSSPGGLHYSRFAVASQAIISGTGPLTARFAALAAGNLGPLADGLTPVPAKPAARLAKDDTPGVIVADGLGGFHTLHDLGEAYTVLAWNPAGTHLLLSGGKSGAAWYADATTGQRWRLPASVNGLAPIAWSDDSRYALLAAADGVATRLVTLDTSTGNLVRSRAVGSAPAADKQPVRDLPLPYVNQIWDTGVAFNGNWACGPTTVAMVLAYYGRLAPWPFSDGQARVSAQDRLIAHSVPTATVTATPTRKPSTPAATATRKGAKAAPSPTPSPTPNPAALIPQDGKFYGQYVTTPFTYKGRTFSSGGADPAGHRTQGLYGTIVGDLSLARWEVMIDVLNLYDVQTSYIDPSWASITAQLDKGYPVVLGTTLTTSGHILVARGYTANGYLLVNDPYGNHNTGYGEDNGGNVAYAWKDIPLHLAMVVRGTITPPVTPTPTVTLTPTASPTPAVSPTAVPTLVHAPVAGPNG
ncbi:MAG: C39 family peptidase [Chloroflexota bacterium]|nr:C39 family peptidase [Chloroflexota bacterium]